MKIKTAKRLYWVFPIPDSAGATLAWSATYRPLNPKTGAPWQASRNVGAFTAHLFSTRAGEHRLVAGGIIPPFEQWNDGQTSCRLVYSTEAEALAATHAFDPATITPI